MGVVEDDLVIVGVGVVEGIYTVVTGVDEEDLPT
jgi:hypothetical protein